MAATQLDRAAVAARYGMKDPASVTVAVRRGSLPKPDGYVGRSPWWWSSTLDEWKRPGRTGRPRRMSDSEGRETPSDDSVTQIHP